MIYRFILLAVAVVLILFAVDVLYPKFISEYGLNEKQKISKHETLENTISELEIK